LWWLVLRLTWSRRNGTPAAKLVQAVGIVFLTVLALATAAVPRVMAAQHDRARAVAPLVDYDTSKSAAAGRLLTLDPLATPTRRWHGHEIVRRYYAANDSHAVIPGIARVPGADEFYTSPDLRALMKRDATIAALFTDFTLIGTIQPTGLVQPHQLAAVIGISPDEQLLVPVTAFGSDEALGFPSDNTVLNASVASLVVLAVWLAGAAFIVVISRLSSRQRYRRARSLRLLGLSALTTRAVHATETAIVALPAAVVGCLLYNQVIHRVTAVPSTSLGYFTSDAQLSLRAYVAVAATLTLVVSVSTATSLRMRRKDNVSTTLTGPPGFLSAAGLTLFIVGTAYLVALPMLASTIGSRAALGLWIACGCVAVGSAAAGPRIVSIVSNAMARRMRAAGTLFGLRMNCWSTTTAIRMGGALGVVIIMLLCGLSFTSILTGGTSTSWKAVLAAHHQIPLTVTDLGGHLTRGSVASIHPSGRMAQTATVTLDRDRVTIVYADCADLEHLTGTAPRSCTGQAQWLTIAGDNGVQPPSRRGVIRTADGSSVTLPSSANTTVVHGFVTDLNGALLLPAAAAPTRPTREGETFFLLVDNDRLALTMAGISARSPTAQFDEGGLTRNDPDNHQFPDQLQLLSLGAVMSLLIGVLALTAATLGDASERGAKMRGLRIIGAPPNQLVRAHAWATGLPIVTLGWLATLAGWQTCLALRGFDDRAVVPTSGVAWCAVGVAAAAILVVAATMPDAVRRMRQSP
jgi:FtsX-like permease family